MRRKHVVSSLILAGAVLSTLPLSGCAGTSKNDGKTEVTMVQYKPEAVDIFEQFQDEFNATHDDIYLKIDSPNDAMTILKIFAEYKKDTEYVQYLEETQKAFGEKVQELCWDNDRFVRGYTESGERIGEAAAPEANMWLNPQSWAVISGLATPEQGDAALNNVYERLNMAQSLWILLTMHMPSMVHWQLSIIRVPKKTPVFSPNPRAG